MSRGSWFKAFALATALVGFAGMGSAKAQDWTDYLHWPYTPPQVPGNGHDGHSSPHVSAPGCRGGMALRIFLPSVLARFAATISSIERTASVNAITIVITGTARSASSIRYPLDV